MTALVILDLVLIIATVSMVVMLNKEKNSIKLLELQQMNMQEEQRQQQESLKLAQKILETEKESQHGIF